MMRIAVVLLTLPCLAAIGIDSGAPWFSVTTTTQTTMTVTPANGSGGTGHTWVALTATSGGGPLTGSSTVAGGGLSWTRRAVAGPANASEYSEVWTATGTATGSSGVDGVLALFSGEGTEIHYWSILGGTSTSAPPRIYGLGFGALDRSRRRPSMPVLGSRGQSW